MAAQHITSVRGVLLVNEPMSRHTTWRVGGPVDHYFVPADIDDLVCYLQGLDQDEPIFWLGLGSNLLVRDGGIRGSVISTANALNGIELIDDQVVEVAAGVPCAKFARFCARNNLINGEFFAGIPGVMGGALAMNAGAFGGETWPLVIEVETINRQGERIWRRQNEYTVGYRTVKGPVSEWFIKARLKLKKGDGEQAALHIKSLLAKRAETQPTGTANCGSVFRNPDNHYAAKLIEDAGLKGYRINGAMVSVKHANFIINTGNATAADIEQLIHFIQQKVEQEFGIQLQTEVKIVGDPL